MATIVTGCDCFNCRYSYPGTPPAVLGYTAQQEKFRPNLYQIFSNDDRTDHGSLNLTEIRQVNLWAPWPKGTIEIIEGTYDPRPICTDCGQHMRYKHVERGDCAAGREV